MITERQVSIAAHPGAAMDVVFCWIERKSLPAHQMGRL